VTIIDDHYEFLLAQKKREVWEYNDGGRKAAGYLGTAGDCGSRAIAIATQLPYSVVYDGLFVANQARVLTRRDKVAKRLTKGDMSPGSGVHTGVARDYLAVIGWQWTPTMFVGEGCTVHLRADELPAGRLIVSISRHLVAVIDGIIHDTYDCSRGGRRCVYGYWQKGTTR
jgi:hypothetical protein